jgi:tetraacyldisaccharide-1-P 4'-kinase
VRADTRCSPAELAKHATPATPEAFQFNSENRVIAFSGIAHNDNFRQTLDSAGFNTARFIEYPDHHWYSDRDFETIQHAAAQSSAHCLATTEKDYARFAHRKTWPLELIVVGVRISFDGDEERFISFLQKKLQE